MPIFVPYLPLHTLHGHVKSVSCLAFSPTGNRLASGGDDGNVIIWEPDQGKILHRVILHGPVTCIVWDPDDSRTRLFVGCGDGVLTVMETFKAQEPSNSVLTGTKASVYAIAADRYTGHISVGLGSEVHIAKEVGPKKYATFKILPSPEPLPQTSPNADQRIRARALEFMTKGTCLLVAYLNHGVVCWDKETAVQLWCIVPIHSHRLIGHAALSPDEKTVLISNLSDGADLYLVGQSHPSNLFKSPSNSQTNVPVQVIFFGGGNSVLCGSVVGCVHIWNVKTGECEQVLDHSGDIVQAVSAYDSIGRSLIVTATSGTSEKTYIKVWKAQTSMFLS
ncbi:WD40-repeat-containing domain protein [Hygrophoropsis aurantiaca]|uniref:WD40-repeat-containing domain protein n=1 Tax=Hygrophoropsis aurantiaca TaxID=72124 RepID=A0ACB8A0J4_9AGAM|nr:WD40-repeat-containing domain protein [Hygrophoropsis aurantiaca]